MRHHTAPGPLTRFVAVAAAALLLVGCSADDAGDSASSASSESLLPAAEGNTQYPLTLTTPWGETVLEERPERIAAMGSTGAELVVALGGTPVGADETLDRAVWVQDALTADIETIYSSDITTGEQDYEAIAASDPDLIVFYGNLDEQSFEKLSAIAPVIGPETEEEANAGLDWRTEIVAVGEALDLSDAAESATADYDAFMEQVRSDNPEFAGLTTTLLTQYNSDYGTTYASAPGEPGKQFLEDLGFAPNPLAEQFAEDSGVSAENLLQVDADVLIVSATNGAEDAELLLTGTELFQQLDAVKNDHWVLLDLNVEQDGVNGWVYDGVWQEGNLGWSLGHGAALIGKRWAVEKLVPILRETLGLD